MMSSKPQKTMINEKSKYYQMTNHSQLTTSAKGQIAELAVMFRLKLLGLDFIHPPEHSKIDLIVHNPENGKLARIQVKAAKKRGKTGKPLFNIVSPNKYEPYVKHCELLVAYDLEQDACYVLETESLKDKKRSCSCQEEAKEKWQLLLDLLKNNEETLL